MRLLQQLLLATSLGLVAASCMSLEYDLSSVPVPIEAKPVDASTSGLEVEPFEIEARNVLWLHGLLGHSEPDVARLVAERAEGWDRIAGFRVRQESNIHHWLATHLSLTIVRMRKVVIEGQLLR